MSNTKYTIYSTENEILIENATLSAATDKFLSYIRETKQEYIASGEKSEEEVAEEMEEYKSDMENGTTTMTNFEAINDCLLDYGFEKLIVTENAQALKYTLILNDIDNEIASEQRVIEYAKNRLIANPEDVLNRLSYEEAQEFISEVIGEDFHNWNNTKNKGIDEENYKEFFDPFIEAINDGNFPEHLEELLDCTVQKFISQDMYLSDAIEIIKSYDEDVINR